MKKIPLFAFLLVSNFFTINAFSQWQWGVGTACPGNVGEAWAIGVDGYGNVYQAGNILGGGGSNTYSVYGTDTVQNVGNHYQVVVSSINASGTYRWELATQNSDANVVNIAVDTNGNTYVLGTQYNLYGTTDMTLGGYSVHNPSCCRSIYWVAKIDSGGNVKWLHSLGNNWLYGSTSIASGIAIGPAGYIYISGNYNVGNMYLGSATLTNTDPGDTTADAFIAKIDTNGTFIWAKNIGGRHSEQVVGLATNTDGSLYVAGTYLSDTLMIGSTTLTNASGHTTPNIFLAKYDTSGNPVWAQSVIGSPIYPLLAVSADVYGNAYIGGGYLNTTFFGTHSLPGSSSYKMYLAAYDKLGNAKWAERINNIYTVATAGIATDICGNIWISGIMATTSSDPITFARFDTAGNHLDSFYLASGGDDQSSIVVDNKGNFYVGGDYMYQPFHKGPIRCTW